MDCAFPGVSISAEQPFLNPLGSKTSSRAHIHGETGQHCSLDEYLPGIQRLYGEEFFCNSTSLCLPEGSLKSSHIFSSCIESVKFLL